MKTPHTVPPRRRRAQRSPERPWEDVLASFTDAVVVLDHDSRVVLFNQAAEELMGTAKARMLREPSTRIFARTPVLLDMIVRVTRSGQSESRGEELLQSPGRSIPVRVTCLPLWGANDQLRGTILVIHDLSYQKTLEENARRNESLARLGTLVAGLAHEVKNPLAGIKGAAQLLESRLTDRPDLRDYTEVIEREVNRLSGLVEDLLSLGAPPKPRLRPTNIHRVIQHVLSVLREELARRGIKLRCEFDPSLPDVQGDDSQLSQVFLNLLKNAMEAMCTDEPANPRRDTITVSTRMETDFHILHGRDRSSKFLRVEISDLGMGIAPQDAVRVFEPFFTTKPRGTGLGLAISQRIVAEHGGIMRATPNRPRGTVLTVTLPVAAS
jgi:two-component system, NtrC family, nitrogen regulation sensor histidine kinase GlnL